MLMGQWVIFHKSGQKKTIFLWKFEKIANNIICGLIILLKWANFVLKLKLILIE